MKLADFTKVLKQKPVYVAVFELVEVPAWAESYVNKGDMLAYHGESFKVIKDKVDLKALPLFSGFNFPVRCVKFIEYRQVN